MSAAEEEKSCVKSLPARGHAALFATLFATTLFLNKYVLSGLGFTYPTVFQGWQMLVGLALLKGLSCCTSSAPQPAPPLEASALLATLPHALLFTAAAVAGSKALSGTPVSVVVSVGNMVPASLCLLDQRWGVSRRKEGGAACWHVPAALTVLCTALLALLLDLPLGMQEEHYFWLVVQVVCQSGHLLSLRLLDNGPCSSAPSLLYRCYVVGVVVLAPSSLYLEEAFGALSFHAPRQILFYLLCGLSGLLGAALGLWAAGPEEGGSSCSQPCARALAAALSALLSAGPAGAAFGPSLPPAVWLLLALNLAAAFWLPPPTQPLTPPPRSKAVDHAAFDT